MRVTRLAFSLQFGGPNRRVNLELLEPEKIDRMMADQGSLGAFLRDLRDAIDEDTPTPPERPSPKKSA